MATQPTTAFGAKGANPVFVFPGAFFRAGAGSAQDALQFDLPSADNAETKKFHRTSYGLDAWYPGCTISRSNCSPVALDPRLRATSNLSPRITKLMISSREDVFSLLNKWKTESTQVVIMYLAKEGDHPKPKLILHVRGHITHLETSPDALTVEGEDRNFGMIMLDGFQFRYGSFPDMRLSVVGDRLENVLILESPGGLRVVMYTAE